MFSASDLAAEKKPVENPDWDHARTARVVLKRPDCELVQSCHSVRIENFTTPNRDYPHEGFSAMMDGVNWKFLDCVAFSLEDGKTIGLSPVKTEVFPHKAVYHYSAEGKPFVAEYYLFKKARNPLLCVSFIFSGNATVRARVFADIREINAPPNGQVHSFVQQKSLCAVSGGKQLRAHSPNATGANPVQYPQHWRYKLGSGERTEQGGKLFFLPVEGTVRCIGEIEMALKKNRADLFISCTPAGQETTGYGLRKHDEQLEIASVNRVLAANAKILEAAEKKWGPAYAKALAARTVCLLQKFAREDGMDAGAMWFRQNWLRDSFEGILANFPAYYAFRKRELKRMIIEAHALEKKGLIPTSVSIQPRYSSIDSTLLCLRASLQYLEMDEDRKVAEAAEKTFRSFEAAALNGKEFTLSNGLLACRADWSWTDSAKTINGIRVPLRLPSEWVNQAMQKPSSKAAIEGPNYFLAEANALWVSLLKQIPENWRASTSGGEAGKEFKKIFWDGKNLTHAYSRDFGAAHEPSSHAIQAVTLAPELFAKEELMLVRKSVEPLLVNRRGKLFGMLVRRTGRPYFLGDDEYHRASVWPRETVYLMKFLDLLGDRRKVEEILLSNLEHQEEEGAIHYFHELFSLPEGGNPSPTETAALPVPVKNPAQYWSQWVQPYYDFLASG